MGKPKQVKKEVQEEPKKEVQEEPKQEEVKQEKRKGGGLNPALKTWSSFLEMKRKENPDKSLKELMKMYGKNGSKNKEFLKYKSKS